MNARVWIMSFVVSLLATTAFACPDPNKYGDTYELHASDLYDPQSVSLIAGGDQQIGKCG